jgi:hypothetical protein
LTRIAIMSTASPAAQRAQVSRLSDSQAAQQAASTT